MSSLASGNKFGRWTVIGKSIEEPKYCRGYSLCECECGRQKNVANYTLTAGKSKSCGCTNVRNKEYSPGESTLNEKYMVCRYTSKTRGLTFSLTIEEYKNIVEKQCYYCGAEPMPYNRYLKKDGTKNKSALTSQMTKKRIDNSWIKINTVDRLDSDKGYSIDNCVPACWPCNEAKMDSTVQDFIDRAYKIVAFQSLKGHSK